MCDGGSRARGRGICLPFCSLNASSWVSGGRAVAPLPIRRSTAEQPQLGPLGERINSNTIAIISGNLNATYVTIAYDLSAVLTTAMSFAFCQ